MVGSLGMGKDVGVLGMRGLDVAVESEFDSKIIRLAEDHQSAGHHWSVS